MYPIPKSTTGTWYGSYHNPLRGHHIIGESSNKIKYRVSCVWDYFVHHSMPEVGLWSHKAATRERHLGLSPEHLSRNPQVHPLFFISFSTVRRQVSLGRPRFLFPSGVHLRAILGSAVFPCLKNVKCNEHIQWFTSKHKTTNHQLIKWPANLLTYYNHRKRHTMMTRLVTVIFIQCGLIWFHMKLAYLSVTQGADNLYHGEGYTLLTEYTCHIVRVLGDW